MVLGVVIVISVIDYHSYNDSGIHRLHNDKPSLSLFVIVDSMVEL